MYAQDMLTLDYPRVGCLTVAVSCTGTRVHRDDADAGGQDHGTRGGTQAEEEVFLQTRVTPSTAKRAPRGDGQGCASAAVAARSLSGEDDSATREVVVAK